MGGGAASAPATAPAGPISAPAPSRRDGPTERQPRSSAPPAVLHTSRRPSGDPPPLPHDWNRQNVTAMAALAACAVTCLASYTVFSSSPLERVDHDLVRLAVGLRSGAVLRAAWIVNGLDRPMWLNSAALATILGAMALRRFRRGVVQLGVLVVAVELVGLAAAAVDLPRPDVEIVGRWTGYGTPAISAAYLAVILLGGAYCFLPAGRPRRLAGTGTVVLLALLAAAKTVLGTTPRCRCLPARRWARWSLSRRSARWYRTRCSRCGTAAARRTSTSTPADRRSPRRWRANRGSG
jgi:hypothetical protein